MALTRSVAVAGLLGGLGLNGAQTSLINCAKQAFIQAGVNATIDAVLTGKDINDILRDTLKNALVDTLAAYGAGQIGKAYSGHTFNFFTHKLAHAVLGAGLETLTAQNAGEGAVVGAIAGALSECLAEMAAGNPAEMVADIEREAKAKGEVITCMQLFKNFFKIPLVYLKNKFLNYQFNPLF